MRLITISVTHPRFLSLILLFSTATLFIGGCALGQPKFDGQRAFGILKKQCEFGPRPLGTEAHSKTSNYLYNELAKYSKAVVLQKFKHARDGKTYELTNIITGFGDTKKPAILLCAHWDTRPTADEELGTSDRKHPIIGANDGASGVAVLLELARMFSERPPAVPVTIVLFDGEDFGPTAEDMLLGSRHFAANLGDKPGYKYGILLDMVGDKELDIHPEGHSQDDAGDVVNKVWETAKKLGYGAYFQEDVDFRIMDDHIPLIQAGLPCADVIDFNYAHWHTLDDTIDKCSPESLRIVGETIAEVIYSEK